VSVTIINGGTQGLGEAVARRLADGGATGLLLAGRSVERGEALAADLNEAGTPTVFVPCDIGDAEAPRRIVSICDERFGRVDGVVNVAANTTRATLFTETPEHFDRLMAVNVKGPLFLNQAAAEVMLREGGGGSIVNVGSIVGHGGPSKLTTYSMTKAALTVMTKNLAFALMRHGIRVNQVNPGWMDTESEHHIQMTEDGAPENWLELAEARVPMGRLVQTWEVANLIAFCLGAESGLLTGQSIDVDQSVPGAGMPNMPDDDDTASPVDRH
jgi:NAD(P)-dependent dehydrogenase (short-subunit alcohol dehydrogenase family)